MRLLKNIVIVFFFSLQLFSQNDSHKFGIIGGLNVSSFTDIEYDAHFGVNFGPFYQTRLSNNFFARTGLYFSQMGNRKATEADTYNYSNIYYKLDYFHLPIDLIFQFKEKPGGAFRIFAGPQLGFLLKQKKEFFDIGDTNKIDFGVNLGIEKVTSHKFSVSLNGYAGLIPIISKSDSFPSHQQSSEIANVAIQLKLAYFIN